MATQYTTLTHLYRTLDDRQWTIAPPSSIRMYPRTPYEALNHGLDYMDNEEQSPAPWSGRAMTAVARCFGLQTADTGKIPRTIPGPRYSAIRQFRWVMATYPEYAVAAPSPFTFGENVPIGAILYWDESTPEGGAVGICAGYRRGIMQVLTTIDNPTTKNWGLRDTVPYGCAGWTVPLFFAKSSMDLWNLWDGDKKTVSAQYDLYENTLNPTESMYDGDRPYDVSRVETENIWNAVSLQKSNQEAFLSTFNPSTYVEEEE